MVQFLPLQRRELRLPHFYDRSSIIGLCLEIMKEIEKRNWEVPGIKLLNDLSRSYNPYAEGDDRYKEGLYVEPRRISGADFSITFNRCQTEDSRMAVFLFCYQICGWKHMTADNIIDVSTI